MMKEMPSKKSQILSRAAEPEKSGFGDLRVLGFESRRAAEMHSLIERQGGRVFVQEYGVENREFVAELKKRGARVSRVPVYRWGLPEDLSPLKTAILEVSDGHADVLLFTNATQIHHVLQVASEEGLEASFRE